MAHDVFISHSSKDKTVADATCAWIEAKGIRCWIAPRDILPGADWGVSIIDGINGARVMVLLLSAQSNASTGGPFLWGQFTFQGKDTLKFVTTAGAIVWKRVSASAAASGS